jgi:microcystin-dependent protein
MWIFVSDGVSDWSIGEMTPDVQPIGTITMFAGPTAPGGWILCQGQAISRSTYSNLFGVIGTAYGVGDGSTTFNLPDMRQRFPLGLAASGTGNTLGATGGNIDHTHAVPGHHHGMGTGADLNITNSGAHTHSIDHDHSSFTSAAESGHTHTIDHDHGSFTSTAASATTQRATVPWTGSGTAGGDAYFNTCYLVGGTTGGEVSQPWGGHTHSIDVPNYTGASGASSGHTHSIDVPNFSGTSGSTAHTHAAGNFAGRIGLVTAGSDGNAAFNTDAKNPPFQVVNYIIKF